MKETEEKQQATNRLDLELASCLMKSLLNPRVRGSVTLQPGSNRTLIILNEYVAEIYNKQSICFLKTWDVTTCLRGHPPGSATETDNELVNGRQLFLF